MTIAVLAIETATDACSVAVLYNGICIEHFEIIPKTHTQRILSLIESVLLKQKLQLSDITVLAFGRGPGSFTGIRIATSIVQGMAYGVSLPVVPISTLQALAQGAYRLYQYSSIFAALDARQNEIYCNTYDLQQGIMEPTQIERVTTIDKLQIEKSHYGVGTGSQLYRALLEKTYPTLHILEENLEYPHAQDIAMLAHHYYQRGEFLSAEYALPTYLRNTVVQGHQK